MKLPCEIMVEKLPVLRAMITYEMINTFNLTQEQVAKKLGISQPAVSQYLAGIRGKKASDKKLRAEAKQFAKAIIEGEVQFPKTVCSICGCHR